MQDFKNTSCALHCFVLCCGGIWTWADMSMHSSTEAREGHGLFHSIILRLIPLTQDLSLSLGLAIFARLASW